MCINSSMRVYRYQYKKKNRISGVSLGIVIGVAAVFLLLQGKEKQLTTIRKELKIIAYEEILEFFMPGLSYSMDTGQDKTVAEEVMSCFFMLESDSAQIEPYETQVESELSYETILAREAADENYVDEKTGEVVMTAGVSEVAEANTAGTGTGTTQQEAVTAEPGTTIDQTVSAISTNSQKQITFSREKLNDFDYLIQNFYQVDSTTTINGEQLNADSLLGKDMRLSHDASTPQILIYHTHSQEGYADSVAGDPSGTVVGVGDYLTKILTEQYGFNVIHHKGEYDVGDRDHAYAKAGPGLEQVLAENPSIEVVIDLHRDGVAEDTRLVTAQNGVQMAQVMFFNGLSRTTSTGDIDYLYNPYLEDNLAMSFQMQLKAAEYYPDFTRRIYLKGYRYNMQYCPKTMLIEVGAQTNTVEEAMNAMVPLADILNKVLTGSIYE